MSHKALARLTSFLVGFASLGQEILWVRIVSFANGNTPQTFALVLSIFLLGIVLGSLLGKRYCETDDLLSIRKHAAWMLALSGAFDLGAPWLLARIETDIWLTPIMAGMILTTATTKATLFPVVHHLGSQAHAKDTGRSLAAVYFLNIAGATLGPILIGFWLLDHWTAQSVMQFLGALALLTSTLLYPKHRWTPALLTGSVALLFTCSHSQQTSLLRSLAFKDEDEDLGFLLENRQGIIHTIHNPILGDAVFGGNIYDGRINVDLLLNSNRIDRVYLLSVLYPQPHRILVIGLGGGAWLRVLSEFEGIEHIDVVEINPGYLDLVRKQTKVSTVLTDPRIQFHIDDGRRWLRRWNGEGYDLIVINTTFHWRAYSTNLLSADFLSIARKHLNPGGILAFNSTGSPDTLMTAASVFPYAFRWRNSNFVYASDHDFRFFSYNQAYQRLLTVALKLHHPDKKPALEQAVQHILRTGWVDVTEEARSAQRSLEIITDQNMITEFKRGKTAWW